MPSETASHSCRLMLDVGSTHLLKALLMGCGVLALGLQFIPKGRVCLSLLCSGPGGSGPIVGSPPGAPRRVSMSVTSYK